MPQRQVISHRFGDGNKDLEIVALDGPSKSGSCMLYRAIAHRDGKKPEEICDLRFQMGRPSQHGSNGLTNESLLAVVEDRLIGFQKGEFQNLENARALHHVKEALLWLQRRVINQSTRNSIGLTGRSKPD